MTLFDVLFSRKKAKKPYLYHTSIDMVFVKMNKISKTISIPYWYRYGFWKFRSKKTTYQMCCPLFMSQLCVT